MQKLIKEDIVKCI